LGRAVYWYQGCHPVGYGNVLRVRSVALHPSQIYIRIKEIYFSVAFFNLFVRKGRKKGKVLTYTSHVMN
jgi:hypothetical protein